MQLFFDLPLAARLIIIGLLGLLTARFINWAIYTWAYFPRRLGPWSPPATQPPGKRQAHGTRGNFKRTKSKGSKSTDTLSRTWLDHLPVLGWWRLRNESTVHGKYYWARPLLVELLYPLALAWYYKFYFAGSTLPPGAGRFLLQLHLQMHWQFIGHWLLFTLLTIATFIDFDERSIPDLVTIPGTVIGLLGAALSPLWLPLTLELNGTGVIGVTELDAVWPDQWPAWFQGWSGLFIALIILLAWGFALLDRRIILRRGMSKAIQYFFAGMVRNRTVVTVVLLVTGGLIGFTTVCWSIGLERWDMFMSSLLGLAFAGGVTWAVRLSASYGFGAEALGFGDVTLMAMIGTYVGWQPSLLIFFLAPVLALGFVLVRWIITRDTATPYGPYLCAAVIVLLIYWDSLWTNWAAPLFMLGSGPILIGLAVCVFLIGVLLWIWQLVKRAAFAIE